MYNISRRFFNNKVKLNKLKYFSPIDKIKLKYPDLKNYPNKDIWMNLNVENYLVKEIYQCQFLFVFIENKYEYSQKISKIHEKLFYSFIENIANYIYYEYEKNELWYIPPTKNQLIIKRKEVIYSLLILFINDKYGNEKWLKENLKIPFSLFNELNKKWSYSEILYLMSYSFPIKYRPYLPLLTKQIIKEELLPFEERKFTNYAIKKFIQESKKK
jgi:hypothetical protein